MIFGKAKKTFYRHGMKENFQPLTHFRWKASSECWHLWIFLFHIPRSACINIIIISVSYFLLFLSRCFFMLFLFRNLSFQCSAAILFWKIIFKLHEREIYFETISNSYKSERFSCISPLFCHTLVYMVYVAYIKENSKIIKHEKVSESYLGGFDIFYHNPGCWLLPSPLNCSDFSPLSLFCHA